MKKRLIAKLWNPLRRKYFLRIFFGILFAMTSGCGFKMKVPAPQAISSSSAVGSRGSATQLVFTTAPSLAGDTDTALATQPVVTAEDGLGATDASYSGTVSFIGYSDLACTGGNEVASGIHSGSPSNVLGVVSFSFTQILKTNVVAVKATDGVLFSACLNTFAINPGAIASLGFKTQPSITGDTGHFLGQAPEVEALDANGNRVTTDSATNITIAAYSDACSTVVGGGLNAMTNPLSLSSGVSSFVAVAIFKTSVIHIGASDGTHTVCSDAMSIDPGQISSLVFSNEPSVSGNADAALVSQPEVTAHDSHGNVVTTDSITHITLTAYSDACTTPVASGVSASTNPLALTSGVSSFQSVTILKTGATHLGASDGTHTVCSTAFAIDPGAVHSLAFSTQPDSAGDTDTVLGRQPVVTAFDTNLNVVSNNSSAHITLTAYSDACTTPVGGALNADVNPLDLASGVATFSNVAIVNTSVVKIGASDGTHTTCSTAMVISPGALHSLVFSTDPSGTANSASAFAIQPSVTAYDTHGNALGAGTSIALSLTLGTPSLSCASTSVLTDVNGVANYSGCKLTGVAGTYSLTATSGAKTATSGDIVLSPPAEDSFARSGDLNSTRQNHTATLLPNGYVLIAGGSYSADNSTARASTELYSSSNDAYTYTSSMSSARESHTATLLRNGKVLIVGGFDGSSTLATAELFDPANSAFSNTGSMSSPRVNHTATLLPNGKVLVVGGYDGLNFLSSAEIYDPDTGMFSSAGDMLTERAYHSAVLMPSGKVLIAGGYFWASLDEAELYDPSTGLFTLTASNLNNARHGHTATLLPNGKVLLVSGTVDSGNFRLTSCELYDPDLDTFTFTGAISTGRVFHTATELPNGKILITGGSDSNPASVASAELYDVDAQTFGLSSLMTSNRYQHTATMLPTGKVLLAGGLDSAALFTSDLYTPTGYTRAGTFTATSNTMSSARYNHTSTLLPNGKVLIAGGNNGGGNLSSADLYDPATGLFVAIGGMAVQRGNHTATLLRTGKVLIVGGHAANKHAELYDPALESFSVTGSTSLPRTYHTATLLPNGKVLIAGTGSGYSVVAEIYDPATGNFTDVASMTIGRAAHAATLLPNGKVLLTGGMKSDLTGLASAEVYDPQADTFTATANSMADNRTFQPSVLLPNGKVLIAGGRDGWMGMYANSADLYDQDTNTFTATAGNLHQGRGYGTGTLLPDGTVLFAAGAANTTSELFDFLTGSFAYTGNTTAERFYCASSLLPNGKVLVTGGVGMSFYDSADLNQ